MPNSSSGKLPHVTTRGMLDMKQRGEKIAMLTAYDYTMARILDRSGVDAVLVGDSASNVFSGHNTTLPITVDEMIYHAKAVVKGVQAETSRAMVIVDMPFMSYQLSPEDAVRNAGKIMKEHECDAVKMEGGKVIAEAVKRITDIGIPVMGHLGLMPSRSIATVAIRCARRTRKRPISSWRMRAFSKSPGHSPSCSKRYPRSSPGR